MKEVFREEKKSVLRIVAAAGLLIVAGLLTRYRSDTVLPGVLPYLLPYLLIGWDVLREALQNIGKGEILDENFLMAIATLGAFAVGEYAEAVFVMLFYQIGELFQDYAVDRSRASIAELMEIRPDAANLETEKGVESVSPEAVAVGAVIVVKPGERIPLDGTVIEGTSALDTAALTGESLPRDVSAGDDVISGCVNQTGLLRIRVTKPCGESTVSKILALVENAGEKKARSEQFITRFARWYTPCVVVSAAALAVIPPLFTGNGGEWFHRALTFLVISCPCALVISVPLSFFGGIGGAARRGILVKSGNDLETLARVETVVFDKTGTLTAGSFSVTEILPEAGYTKEEVLETAALAESWSDHPIAQSLRAACSTAPDPAHVLDAAETAGHGVTARVDGRAVTVGNARLMEAEGIRFTPCVRPGTEVYVAVDGRCAGCIVISDRLKPDAADAVAQLKACGVRRTVMLTGDGEAAAQAAAKGAGIDEVHARLLPADKVTRLEMLIENANGPVAFAGDGINDAPVLIRSDVGIAMGALGSDAAIEAADVVLMDDRLSGIASAVQIARKTLRIVRQNIVFALSVKAVVLLLGAFGKAPMWLAVFADVGVSFLAILNAIRCLKAEKL